MRVSQTRAGLLEVEQKCFENYLGFMPHHMAMHLCYYVNSWNSLSDATPPCSGAKHYTDPFVF